MLEEPPPPEFCVLLLQHYPPPHITQGTPSDHWSLPHFLGPSHTYIPGTIMLPPKGLRTPLPPQIGLGTPNLNRSPLPSPPNPPK